MIRIRYACACVCMYAYDIYVYVHVGRIDVDEICFGRKHQNVKGGRISFTHER